MVEGEIGGFLRAESKREEWSVCCIFIFGWEWTYAVRHDDAWGFACCWVEPSSQDCAVNGLEFDVFTRQRHYSHLRT
jgi:hypothetical protein